MSEEYRRALWHELMEAEGYAIDLVIERATVEPDRSFSEEAMERLHDEMIVYVGTRIVRRWNRTGEPPTALLVELRVSVS